MPKQADLRLNGIELLTRRELASVLKKGISSIDLIPETELPRVHLGKSIRFTLQSVNTYIQRHESSTGKRLPPNVKRRGKDKC